MIKLNRFWTLQKSLNQTEIFKIESLCNTLQTAEQCIKLVVGEKHFGLECQLF